MSEAEHQDERRSLKWVSRISFYVSLLFDCSQVCFDEKELEFQSSHFEDSHPAWNLPAKKKKKESKILIHKDKNAPPERIWFHYSWITMTQAKFILSIIKYIRTSGDSCFFGKRPGMTVHKPRISSLVTSWGFYFSTNVQVSPFYFINMSAILLTV